MIKIALADDHVLMRRALAMLIAKTKGFSVAMQADNGAQLLQQLRTKPLPDIVLLDTNMPGVCGVETAILLQRHFPKIKVVVFTELKSRFVNLRMQKSGVRAYLYKNCNRRELFAALREVYVNGYYFNEQLPADTPMQKPSFFAMNLNDQQRAFLRWASTGLTHQAIAEKMNVSPRTVDSYRDILFKKLEVNSRIGLVLYAVRNGYVKLDEVPRLDDVP